LWLLAGLLDCDLKITLHARNRDSSTTGDKSRWAPAPFP
jgi:hypothetical protein